MGTLLLIYSYHLLHLDLNMHHVVITTRDQIYYLNLWWNQDLIWSCFCRVIRIDTRVSVLSHDKQFVTEMRAHCTWVGILINLGLHIKRRQSSRDFVVTRLMKRCIILYHRYISERDVNRIPVGNLSLCLM